MHKIFKVLGCETRLRIVKMLQIRECCVCELSGVLGLSNSTISEHLSKLKKNEIIKEKKKSYWSYYSINKKFFKNEEMEKLFKVIKNLNDKIYEVDQNKLKQNTFKCDFKNK